VNPIVREAVIPCSPGVDPTAGDSQKSLTTNEFPSSSGTKSISWGLLPNSSHKRDFGAISTGERPFDSRTSRHGFQSHYSGCGFSFGIAQSRHLFANRGTTPGAADAVSVAVKRQ
jgi:hypothetical protein